MSKIIKLNIINFLTLIFFEVVFAIISFDTYTREEVFSVFIYSLFSSFVITLLMTVWSEKVNRIFSYIIFGFLYCIFVELCVIINS